MTLELIQTCWKAVREFGARERDPLGFIVGHKLVLLALGDQWQRLGDADAAIDAYHAHDIGNIKDSDIFV
jgi:hypothetical protein